MADTFPVPEEKDPAEWWATANTPRGQEIATAEAQRGFGQNIKAGFKGTALSDAMTLVEDEVAPLVEQDGGDIWNPIDRFKGYAQTLMGERIGDIEDYSEQYTELTTGIPSRFHEEILDEPNADAAGRSRARILNQIEQGRIAGMQQGFSGNLAMLAGSVLDLDAPLAVMTGGGYKAAAISRKAVQFSRKAGLSPQAALRTSSAAVGANAGLQAGLVVGGAQSQLRETADWTLIAEAALTSMLLGGAINPLMKGDVALGARAAQEELHKRVARDDSSLYDAPDIDPASADRLHAGDNEAQALPEDADLNDTSVGARQVNPQPNATVTPMDGNLSDAVHDIGTMADNWRHDSDWQDWKIADDEHWWAQVAMNGLFNVSTDNFRNLYRSESSVMNWMLGNVYESPNGMGRGRYTAAAGNEMYQRRIAQQFVKDTEVAAKDWARRTGNLTGGITPSKEGLRAFNREVMLEQNDRLMGRTPASPRDPAIRKAADAYDRAGAEGARIGRGEEGQLSVDGFDQIDAKSGYTPYVWKGSQVMQLEADGVVTRRNLTDAMAAAYRSSGMGSTKDAKAVAEAVVARAIAKDTDVDTNLIALLSGDGREFLNDALERNGMSTVEREALLERLTGSVEDKGKEGFAKRRNDIDLNQRIVTEDGSDLKIVDLMDNDLHGVWQKYSRRMAGSAALARVGITNKAQREQFIAAAQAQQRALGEEPFDADTLRAMFTHFDGGPVHGNSAIFGKDEGVAPVAALVKRMTNLALLGKLGFAQAAETGATIASVGLENWATRGPMAAFNAELKAGKTELLNDMAFIIGDLGEDHKLFSEHLDLDDMNASDRGQFMQFMQGISQKGSYVQGFASGFNHVRGWQQRVATSAMTDKIFRTLKAEMDKGNTFLPDGNFRDRMRADLGLFDDDIGGLMGLIEEGLIEFKTVNGRTFVNRINADKWPPDQALKFGASITRNMNQVVQRSMAGEQDSWMSTTVGSVMTHLKTFPLQAMQKQFVRNIRHSDMQTVNTLMMGMATATVAVMVKDAIDGRERSMKDTAKTAFGYSNLTGWVPMVTDPAMTMLGMEDARINQYGPHNDYTPATMTWLNNASRLPGAVADTVTGEADYFDRQSLKALPFANLAGLGRVID